MKAISLNNNETIIKCVFNSEKCYSTDFEYYFSSFYGNCFRFNTGKDENGNPVSLKKITQSGDLYGLRLELFVGDINKTPELFNRNGFQVMVNNQSVLPGFNEGITVSPGTEKNIRISRIFNDKTKRRCKM